MDGHTKCHINRQHVWPWQENYVQPRQNYGSSLPYCHRQLGVPMNSVMCQRVSKIDDVCSNRQSALTAINGNWRRRGWSTFRFRPTWQAPESSVHGIVTLCAHNPMTRRVSSVADGLNSCYHVPFANSLCASVCLLTMINTASWHCTSFDSGCVCLWVSFAWPLLKIPPC